MTNKAYLSNTETSHLARTLYRRIVREQFELIPPPANGIRVAPVIKIYGVPRGGIPVTYLLKAQGPNHIVIVDNPLEADIIVDDIIDSGSTRDNFTAITNKPFYALIDKITNPDGKWYVFPWEEKAGEEEGVEANVTRILQYIGEDPARGGLIETPKRFSKALGEWFSGYNYSEEDIKNLLKVFEDGADNYDQMVIVKDIPIYSKCEHHVADIFGTATIAYIPNGKIVGLSKLSRLADVFARRLQVQERLTGQIADSLQKHLNPLGVGVIIRARHMCMESRGLCQQGHHTISIALRGVLKEDAAARAEFMSLA